MQRFLSNLAHRLPFRSQAGVTAIEYALIASLIAIVVVTSVTLIGTNLKSIFSTIARKI